MGGNNQPGTLLQRRRKSVKVDKEETVLMLRTYLAHPTSSANVLAVVRQNWDYLSEEDRMLYRSGNNRQLGDWNKLCQLVKKRPVDISDMDIRSAVRDIQTIERRLINQQLGEEPQAGQPNDERNLVEQDPHPGPANRRNEAAAALDTDDGDEEDFEQPVRVRPNRRGNKRHRKRPLANLIWENHILYNNFRKRKNPKLLR